ncbi:hypothetical protein ACO0LB_00510 [Undibacterium sp. SXout7W]|uniref:hypothetical protein n=1 Tax=Undibacterium sp. SXout7W TaxID=3413049 RepID=UPI003BF012C6
MLFSRIDATQRNAAPRQRRDGPFVQARYKLETGRVSVQKSPEQIQNFVATPCFGNSAEVLFS